MANDVKIDKSLVDENINNMKKIINNRIIDESVAKGNEIIGLLGNSDGEFVTALKEEIRMEINTVTAIGFMLNKLCDFISAASDDFICVDNSYSNKKVNGCSGDN